MTGGAGESLAMSRRIALALLATTLFLALIAGQLFHAHQRIVADVGSVAHTHRVLERLHAVQTALGDAETAQRGFLLTGDESYLEPYRHAREALPALLRELGSLLANTPEQQRRLDELARLAREKLAELARTVQQRRAGETAAALTQAREGEGEALTDAIREQVAAMRRFEETLADRRDAELGDSVNHALLLGLAGVCVSFLFLLLMYWLVRHEAQRRREKEHEIERSNQRLTEALARSEALARELALLARMGELLQSSRELGEAYEIIHRLLPELLPRTAGAVSVINASETLVETVLTWGTPPEGLPEAFAPDECWALRRGRMHAGEEAGSAVPCPHLSGARGGEPVSAATCVPLVAYGETLGVLTACAGEADAIRALERTLQSVAEQVSLALANLRLQETLRSLSIRDPLTGVFNRRFMEASLERELARARRAQQPLGVLMIDIDRFKPFNDQHGHDAGDAVLAGFGELLRRSFREEDVVCRYGGEEFLVILPASEREQSHERAEALCAAVRGFEPYHERRPLPRITVSIGVACFPADGDSAESLVRAADAALYRAKDQGRDRVVVAGEGDRPQA